MNSLMFPDFSFEKELKRLQAERKKALDNLALWDRQIKNVEKLMELKKEMKKTRPEFLWKEQEGLTGALLVAKFVDD